MTVTSRLYAWYRCWGCFFFGTISEVSSDPCRLILWFLATCLAPFFPRHAWYTARVTHIMHACGWILLQKWCSFKGFRWTNTIMHGDYWIYTLLSTVPWIWLQTKDHQGTGFFLSKRLAHFLEMLGHSQLLALIILK